MKEKLKTEILEFLDIREKDIFSDLQIFDLLDKKRKTIHPDRTTDSVVKSEYEEKVKIANRLYHSFGELIKEKTTSDIQLYKEELLPLEYINVKFENDDIKEKLIEAQKTNEILQQNIKEKDKIIKSLNNNKIKEETDKLKIFFKPKTNNLFFLGIPMLFGTVVSVLSKTESVMNFIYRYASKSTIDLLNSITLILFLIIIILFISSYIKEYIINKWIDKVNSSDFISSLFEFIQKQNQENIYYRMSYIDNNEVKYKFNEKDVYDYIKSSFAKKNKYINICHYLIRLNCDSIFENLKNIVIYKLINKDAIMIIGNYGFNKEFACNLNINYH